MSYLAHLECSLCSKTFTADKIWNLCPECGKPLLARYNLEQMKKTVPKEDLSKRDETLWRYRELLPIKNPKYILSLGEGFTPLIKATRLSSEMGFERLYIKDEGVNPTGSFKARGLSVAASKAFELGVKEFSIPSAGNAISNGSNLRPCSCMSSKHSLSLTLSISFTEKRTASPLTIIRAPLGLSLLTSTVPTKRLSALPPPPPPWSFFGQSRLKWGPPHFQHLISLPAPLPAPLPGPPPLPLLLVPPDVFFGSPRFFLRQSFSRWFFRPHQPQMQFLLPIVTEFASTFGALTLGLISSSHLDSMCCIQSSQLFVPAVASFSCTV